MDTSPSLWQTIAIQIPVVTIFCLFVLYLLKGFRDWLDKRDQEWRGFLAERQSTWQSYIREEQESWRLFLDQLTQDSKESQKELSIQIREVGKLLSKLNQTVTLHDEKITKAIEELKRTAKSHD